MDYGEVGMVGICRLDRQGHYERSSVHRYWSNRADARYSTTLEAFVLALGSFAIILFVWDKLRPSRSPMVKPLAAITSPPPIRQCIPPIHPNKISIRVIDAFIPANPEMRISTIRSSLRQCLKGPFSFRSIFLTSESPQKARLLAVRTPPFKSVE